MEARSKWEIQAMLFQESGLEAQGDTRLEVLAQMCNGCLTILTGIKCSSGEKRKMQDSGMYEGSRQ